jgi:hypothetical protein
MILPPSIEYRQFQSSIPLRTGLDEILKNETIKKAVEAVKSCALPETLPLPVVGQAFDITVAHHYYFMMGINQAFRMLHGLTDPTAKSQLNPAEDEYTYSLPPELRPLTPKL